MITYPLFFCSFSGKMIFLFCGSLAAEMQTTLKLARKLALSMKNGNVRPENGVALTVK